MCVDDVQIEETRDENTAGRRHTESRERIIKEPKREVEVGGRGEGGEAGGNEKKSEAQVRARGASQRCHGVVRLTWCWAVAGAVWCECWVGHSIFFMMMGRGAWGARNETSQKEGTHRASSVRWCISGRYCQPSGPLSQSLRASSTQSPLRRNEPPVSDDDDVGRGRGKLCVDLLLQSYSCCWGVVLFAARPPSSLSTRR